MDEISREEFNSRLSAAVRTTISLLEDAALFEDEVLRLLQEGDPPLRRLTKKVIRASKERGDSYGQKFIPKHLGAIYGPAELVKDTEEPGDDDTQDDDGEEGDERGEVVLESSSPYVFLKIAFYDARASHQEPYVLFGRIRSISSIHNHDPFTSPVKTKRNRLKHLLAAVHPKSAGKWVDTRARFSGKAVAAGGGKGSQRLAILLDESVAYHPLYELRSEDAPTRVASDLSTVAKSLSTIVDETRTRRSKAKR